MEHIMIPSRFMALLLLVSLATVTVSLPHVQAQKVAEPAIQQDEVIQAVRRLLEKIKIKTDYRLGTRAVTLTTPARALYTVVYDIRDLLEKQQLRKLGIVWSRYPEDLWLRKVEPAQKTELLVEALVSAIDP